MTDNRNNSPRTIIIVPAHNEADSLAGTLKDLADNAAYADVLVVDDGSADATASVARSCGAAVVRLPINLGVGGAMQTGYMYAAQNGYDVAVQFDGDGQHRANQISLITAAILAGQADLVVGSRLLEGVRYRFHPLRYAGNRLLGRMISILVRKPVTDPTSGFRAAGRRMIRFFAVHYPQVYLGDTAEALVWASRAGMRITEAEVRMSQREAGQSATRSIKGFWLTVRIILAILIDCIEKPLTEDSNTDSGVSS